jgi:uncharacterized protein (DUF2147 family)
MTAACPRFNHPKKNFSRMPVFVLLVFLFSFRPQGSAPAEDAILGVWITENNEAKVLIERTQGKYHGKILSLAVPYNSNGLPKRDFRNKDPRLRERALIGIDVISGLHYNETKKRWEGGKVYIPKLGQEANCILELESSRILEVRGYLASPIVSHTQRWMRAE